MTVGAATGRTGHGATITFGTSTFTGLLIHSIGGLKRTRKAVDATHLSLALSSEALSVPGEVISLEPIPVRIEWSQSFANFPPLAESAETITITYPLRASETSNATLAGSGFLIEDESGEITTDPDNVMEGGFTIMFDGATGPTYTKGS